MKAFCKKRNGYSRAAFTVTALLLTLHLAAQTRFEVVGDIDLKGKLLINSNAGTSGQVLTSNGNGSAPQWSAVSSGACPVGGKFAITYANNSAQAGRFGFSTTTGSTQDDTLDIASVVYNTNSDVSINTTSNVFTINRTGLYQFEGTVRFFLTDDQSALPRAAMRMLVDPLSGGNQNVIIREDRMDQTDNTTIGPNFKLNLAVNFIMTRYLIAGSKLAFITEINNISTLPVAALGVSSGGYLSGQFISE